MILADKIILLRKKKGWSQEQLAEKLDISRQSVSKWESGASVPELSKVLKMSEIFGVSTDYLLKEEIEDETQGVQPVTEGEAAETEKKRSVSVEEANAYMDLAKKVSTKIATGVILCILSPVCLILLAGLSEQPHFFLSQNAACFIGIVILLLFVVLGVAILISAGMRLNKYEYLEKEKISLQYGISGIVKKRKEEFEAKYTRSIVTGVCCCILSVAPLMVAGALESADIVYIYCVCILILLVACGVWQFVHTGVIHGSFEKLLQEGEYTEENKEFNQKTQFLPGAYWCIVTAIYLAVSLPTHAWEFTWMIWAIAGVLYAAILGILRMFAGKKKN